MLAWRCLHLCALVEGNSLSWTFQVVEVNKVLASVSALVDSNHRVTFDKDERTGMDISFIVDSLADRNFRGGTT